ncbi:uncharacterized protein LOC133832699 [Humulus lupulus]|uniref:uncharacterized protein LOC133832699 n=1 Tax=Humulus lupulus TaxID=3486 RepID=UPI002B40A69E|nr:uncharacterized protein LOC133832699 [Humulus lupulus]
MNASIHIRGFIEKQTSEQIENNRLRLQVTIDVVKWLALQACAFQGRDKSKESINRGNFHELLKLLASYNDKRNDKLKAQYVELATKIANDEIESGKRLNQISTLKQTGDTHFSCNQLLSFEFVFILHLMKEILKITRILCVDLQRQSQDILNVMHIVANLDAQYVAKGGRSRNQQDKISVMQYYRVDIFITTLDYQLQELNSRFNEHSVELLVLSTAFDPRDGFKFFKIDDICKLAEKFYPDDFSEQEVRLLTLFFVYLNSRTIKQ